jgi:Holliday junction resolvase
MVNYADRGKDAEGQVEKVLNLLVLRADTAFYRLPDAKAGSRKQTLADYLMVHKGMTFLLEVKETAHDYRLPHGNFEKDQVARMQRFKLAGAQTHVLIYHSKIDKWRSIELEFFRTRVGGSWDLRDFPLQDLSEILKEGETYTSVLVVPKPL